MEISTKESMTPQIGCPESQICNQGAGFEDVLQLQSLQNWIQNCGLCWSIVFIKKINEVVKVSLTWFNCWPQKQQEGEARSQACRQSTHNLCSHLPSLLCLVFLHTKCGRPSTGTVSHGPLFSFNHRIVQDLHFSKHFVMPCRCACLSAIFNDDYARERKTRFCVAVHSVTWFIFRIALTSSKLTIRCASMIWELYESVGCLASEGGAL